MVTPISGYHEMSNRWHVGGHVYPRLT